MNTKYYILFTILLSFSSISNAQLEELNVIETGVPLLGVHLNAQSMGSGWVGVVASDINTQNGLDQNPALLARNKDVMGFQFLNYINWAPQIATINSRLFQTGYYQSFNKHAFGISLRYNSLPNVAFGNNLGSITGQFNPYEIFTQFSYAIRLSENFSLGTSLKYIHSNLTGGAIIQNMETRPGRALAGDLGLDYRKNLLENEHLNIKWNLGLSILNLGNKVRYAETAQGQFLPQTLKLGNMLTFKLKFSDEDYLALDLSYQANKLLVPTPPKINPFNGDIVAGMDPDVSVIRAIYQSFYDAPGVLGEDGSRNVFREEMREIIHQFGAEARASFLDNRFLLALRTGLFREHFTKGNRNYLTLGTGIGVCGFRFDVARPISFNNMPNLGWFWNLGARFNLGEGRFFSFKER
jgi:hypothetical protein